MPCTPSLYDGIRLSGRILLGTVLLTWAVRVSQAAAADELTPVEAVRPVATGPRKVELAPRYGSKFAKSSTKITHTVTNPYLDTAGVFFAGMSAIHCTADNGLVITGSGGLDANFRATTAGAWKVSSDGSIRPLHLRSTQSRGGDPVPLCEAPFNDTRADLGQVGTLPDGSLLLGSGTALLKVRPDGHVQRLAGPSAACGGGRNTPMPGMADGAADASLFNKLRDVVPDPQGNVWMVDQDGCSLRRLSPDGQVSTIIPPERVCRKDLKGEDQLLLSNLTWDAASNELVSGGWLTVAKPVHNLYNTLWRIKPNGEFRRVHFSTKLGKSPARIGLDGITTGNIAVDAKGRIHIITTPMIFEQRGFDIMQIYRVDEAKNTVTPITGHKVPRGSYVPELHRDGPAELAVFEKARGLCSAPDGSFYVLEEHLVRKLDAKGQVSTWLF